MSTKEELTAQLAERAAPTQPAPAAYTARMASAYERGMIRHRQWAAEQTKVRLDAVTIGLPDPIDAFLAHPPAG